MRTIIAGTDFSASSVNACKYAAMLAQKINCKLTLFNLLDAPLIHSNVGLHGFFYTSIRSTANHKTEKLMRQMHRSFPNLKIESFSTTGSFKDELKYFVDRHQVVAAVMGLEAKERISKYLFGSHGVNLSGKIDCPVIIVPSKYRDHELSKVLLAVDNNEKLMKQSLKGFEKFLMQTHSNIDLLHVRTPMELFEPKTNALKLNKKHYEIHVLNAKNFEDGIKKRCTQTRSNMIAIISKTHSTFYNLFSESHTKRIAFAAKVPVMSVHE